MMSKKILTIFVIMIILAIVFIIVKNDQSRQLKITDQEIQQKFLSLKVRYDKLKVQGVDVSDVEQLGKDAKMAYDKGYYKKANEFLDKASDMLEKLESKECETDADCKLVKCDGAYCDNGKCVCPNGEPTEPEIPVKSGKLSDVKVASQYRRITDGIAMGRSVDDVIEIFKETQTDFIFQGWIRQNPCPETCLDLSGNEREKCEQNGYSYEYLKNAISEIKKEMPDIIFGGGILAEFLNPECKNPQTGETFGKDQTWEMALDPSKWGISKTKKEFQTEWAISRGWTKKGQSYNPKEQMHFYFPDLTNSEFQKLFLSWANKQIDCGADSIWIDMLYMQAELLKRETGDVKHSSVKDSFKAASELVNEIHKYGELKGKNSYVISWAQPIIAESPYPTNLDAVMTTLAPEEVSSMSMDERKWDIATKRINELDDVVIFARIDYGKAGSPLSVFSQELSSNDQKKFLKIADDFYKEKGIKFIYPIHGGNMGSYGGKDVKILSFGKVDWYDSLSPEFNTYETIKELALKKAGE